MVQNTEGHHDWMKTVEGVVIAKCLTVMKESNAAGTEYLNRKRPKCNFVHLNFLRGRENLRVIRNTKWHHDCMKTVGGVAIAKPCIDRTEIEGEIDELLSAKWSTWNTLSRLATLTLMLRGRLGSSVFLLDFQLGKTLFFPCFTVLRTAFKP